MLMPNFAVVNWPKWPILHGIAPYRPDTTAVHPAIHARGNRLSCDAEG